MKVLLINYFYPPLTDAQVYRWAQITHEWTKSDDVHVDVICGNFNQGMEINPQKNIKIYPTGLKKNALKGSRTNSLGVQNSPKRIIILLKRFYRTFFWPDGLWHWLPFAFAQSFRLRRKKYDSLITFSPTFSSHIVGLLMKMFFKNRTFWLADYGDPFSTSESMQPNNFSIYRKLNHFVEKAVLHKANLVTFTNTQTLESYRKRFGSNFNALVLPHLVDLDLFYRSQPRNLPAKIKMTYVGNFHKGIREPDRLLKIFVALGKESKIAFELNLYGPQGVFSFQDLGPHIIHHGPLPRDSAIEVIRESDILINVENMNCVMTPSKVVEYVATGNPIINILSDNSITPILKELESLGWCLNIPNNLDVTKAVVSIHNFISQLKKTERFNPCELLSSYNLENVSKDFLSKLNRFSSS